MNLGAIIALLKLAQDIGITEPSKPTARKLTISIGKTPLIVPVGFEPFTKEIGQVGLRPKGL